MKKIAIYGKGGIGKSTTTSNISAALADMGYRVLQIGCDPKADSTKNLVNGKKITSVLDAIREKGDGNITCDDVLFQGYGGVWCVEAGGPTPGIGCAGRGIITAFEKLEEIGAYEVCRPDVILYDVLGDVVCGGFAMPIRGGYARNVFIVTSGEMMSLYAASNIASAVKNFGKRGYAQYSGVILNSRKVENEEALVKEALKEIGGEIVSVLPRSESVQEAENLGKTVIEALPESAMADAYRKLAAHMIELSAEVENNYDYLAGFSEKAFPDSCMIMNFGEYSDRTFFEKAAKIYEEQRICAYFPEILVVDKRRLNNRLIPKSYEELTDPVYEKELCILGMPSLPDPALALYLLRSMGEEGVEALAKNVGCFVPPSKTIRHIGKKSNVYGSIFVMPALFAKICLENPQAEVIVPQKGALAEPMLLLQKKQGRYKKEVLEFFHSDIFVSMMAEKQMPVPEDSRFSISPLCQRPFLPEEVETVLVIFQRKNQ